MSKEGLENYWISEKKENEWKRRFRNKNKRKEKI